MQKLLITFGTRPLAQRLYKILAPHFQIIFATSEEVPTFLAANYQKIPTGVNPTFAHEALKLCLDNQIDCILPLGLSEIQSLSSANVLFEEYGIHILAPNQENLNELFVLENPSSSVDLILCQDGKSLISDKDLGIKISGLFALADEGEDLALCTI